MSLEAATYISQLSTSDPPGGDPKAQGDDHLRLIKSVLQSTFPGASKAWYNPNSVAKSANYNVVAADMNKTFFLTTSGGAITMTLPTLAAGDAGWGCSFFKIGGDTNPYFIAPPSGVIQSGEYGGLAKTRRCIPGRWTWVVWTGSFWAATRVCGEPIGTILDNSQPALPSGYELANGQTLSPTDYPDYNAAMGGNGGLTVDVGGRVVVGLDTTAAGRVTTAGSGIDSATIYAAGGAQNVTLARANLPNDAVSVEIAAGQGAHVHEVRYNAFGYTAGAVPAVSSVAAAGGVGAAGAALSATLPFMTGSFALNGSVTQTVVNKMPPVLVLRKVVVVE